MERKLETLRKSERAALMLRGIYEQYGYRNFRMGKFEEYDFYLANRDFLPSENIIAFADLNGKLMALKPDVTMSIVKNTRATPKAPERAYYTESIYRVSREVRAYREIFQVGLEYIGSLTPYAQIEVVSLAMRSLACVEEDYVLDVSHMGFLTGLLEEIPCTAECAGALLACIEQKNAHELRRTAARCGLDAKREKLLLDVLAIGGPMEEMLPRALSLCRNESMSRAVDELAVLCAALSGTGRKGALRLDFSVTSDPKYYNGLMFRGFVPSVPRAVLSGGRYDRLLRRMGKEDLEAIGFALYFDEIDRYFKDGLPAPFDAVLLFDESDDPVRVFAAAERLRAEGKRVLVTPDPPTDAAGIPVLKFVDAAKTEAGI